MAYNPRVVISNPALSTPEVHRDVTEALRAYREQDTFANELATSALTDTVNHLGEYTVRAGEMVGVDLSNVAPDPAHYHFFERQEDYQNALIAVGDTNPLRQRARACRLPQGIFMVVSGNEAIDTAIIGHEMQHDVAAQTVMPVYREDTGTYDIGPIVSGFSGLPGAFIDESLTDLANIKMLVHAGKKEVFTYPFEDHVMISLIGRAARKQGVHPHDIFAQLQYGRLMGNTACLYSLEEDDLEYIRPLPTHQTYLPQQLVEKEQAIATSLDVPDAVKALADFDEDSVEGFGRWMQWVNKNQVFYKPKQG